MLVERWGGRGGGEGPGRGGRPQHRRTASAGSGYARGLSPLHVEVSDFHLWGEREASAGRESDGEGSDLSMYSHSPLTYLPDMSRPLSHASGYTSYRHWQRTSWHPRGLPDRSVRSSSSQEGGMEPGHGGGYDCNAERGEPLVHLPMRVTAFCFHSASKLSPHSPAAAKDGGSGDGTSREEGGQRAEGVGKVMKLPGSMSELKENMTRVFGVQIVRVMNEEWGEVDDIELIRDGDVVFALPEGGSPLGEYLDQLFGCI